MSFSQNKIRKNENGVLYSVTSNHGDIIMAIQGVQNLTKITINPGAGAGESTEERAGAYNAFENVELTGYQQGGNINFGTVYFNNYYVTGNGTTVVSGSGTTLNTYVTTGVTGDVTYNNTYNISGATLSGGYLNIESFGAVANTDSTTAIQNCINAAFASGFGVFVPGKAYRISSTINFPYKIGGEIKGIGNCVPTIDNQGSALFGGASRWVWYGGPNGVMVNISGVGLTWDGLHLIGNPTRANVGTGIIGIQLSHGTAAGLGTTKAQFKSITINNCDIGVSFAATGDVFAFNNDHALWGDVYMIDCTTGFLIASEQAIGHHVQKFDFSLAFTPGRKHTAVVSRHGGVFYCDDFLGTQSGLTVLELIGAGPGHNNDNFVFKNVKFDNQALAAKLVDMSRWQPSGSYTVTTANIRFQDVKVSYIDYNTQPETYAIDVYGGVKLLLDNVDKLQPNSIRLRGKSTEFPNVSIANSRLWTGITTQTGLTSLIHAGSSGTYYWRTHNVSSWSGIPFRDTGNYTL